MQSPQLHIHAVAFSILVCILFRAQYTCAESENSINNEDYINPFDLNFDPSEVKMKKGNTESVHQSPDVEEKPNVAEHNQREDTVQMKETAQCSTDKSSEILSTLFTQYVMQLVRLVEAQVGSTSVPSSICLRLRMTYHDLFNLRAYGQGDNSDMHLVHETLSHILQDARPMAHMDSRIYWLEERLGLSVPVLTQVSIIFSSAVVILKTLPRLRWWIWLSFIYAVSVVFVWLEMFQKEQATQEKLLRETRFDSCQSQIRGSWWGSALHYISSVFTFQEDNCREYYQAMMVSPMAKVTPLEACFVALVKTVVAPMGVIGSGVRTFLVAILKDLPIQYQMYVLLFLAFIVMVTPFLVCGYRFRIPWLLTIEPAPTHQAVKITCTSGHITGSEAGAMRYQGLEQKQDRQVGILSDQFSALSISTVENKSSVKTNSTILSDDIEEPASSLHESDSVVRSERLKSTVKTDTSHPIASKNGLAPHKTENTDGLISNVRTKTDDSTFKVESAVSTLKSDSVFSTNSSEYRDKNSDRAVISNDELAIPDSTSEETCSCKALQSGAIKKINSASAAEDDISDKTPLIALKHNTSSEQVIDLLSCGDFNLKS